MERHREGRAVNSLSADCPGFVGVFKIGASRLDFSMTSQYQYRLSNRCQLHAGADLRETHNLLDPCMWR